MWIRLQNDWSEQIRQRVTIHLGMKKEWKMSSQMNNLDKTSNYQCFSQAKKNYLSFRQLFARAMSARSVIWGHIERHKYSSCGQPTAISVTVSSTTKQPKRFKFRSSLQYSFMSAKMFSVNCNSHEWRKERYEYDCNFQDFCENV